MKLQRNKADVAFVFDALGKLFPDPKTELIYGSPFQLLIAVILSAQCTDERVNQVTPNLFQKYPTPEKLAKAPLSEVEKIIHSCGFYHNKAKSIIHASQALVERFDGKVPSSLEDLTSLAGVGRKTASVVMNQAFDLPAIAVDTHVARVSARLGWTKNKNPVIIEKDLKELLPKSQWSTVNTLLILHGRRTCKARKPVCGECSLQEKCPSSLV